MPESAPPTTVDTAGPAPHTPGVGAALSPRSLAKSVPTVLVFAVLGGLLFVGHRTGWTVPTFSALTGKSARPADDWCAEHGVPESVCVECNPDLLPRPKVHGWCKTHGVHECPLCHPDVAQTPTRPVVTEADRERAARALALADRPQNSSKCVLHERRVQFVSAEAADKAGVDVRPVETGPVVEAVAANGEVVYDQTRTARLSARTAGSVFRAYKAVGEPVRRGEVVALVDAAEVGRAKAEFLHAVVQARLKGRVLENLRSSSGAVAGRAVTEAEAAHSEARIRLTTAEQALVNLGLPIRAAAFEAVADDQLADRLRFLGLPATLTESFDSTTTGNLLPVTAPFDGVVVTRNVVDGELVDPTKVLFVVVDPRRMWLTLDLRREDARAVKLGQPVRFRPGGGADEVTGTVAWISTEIDHKTRTLKVRADLENADGRLKANTFGAGRVVLREEPKAVLVPSSAIHWEGDCHVVFVRDRDYLKPDAPKVFHTRTVRVGVKDDTNTEIIAGLLPGEVVAVKGSGALRAELLRGNMGEG